MAFYDAKDRSTLRTDIRRELLDEAARWWTNSELHTYITRWQDVVQHRCELVWGTATTTVSSTATWTLPSDVLRPARLYVNNKRQPLFRRTQIDAAVPDWRAASRVETPQIGVLHGYNEVTLWPPLLSTATATLELHYPKLLDALASDGATSALPAWTTPSAARYGAYRAYLREGPNQDVRTAAKYRTLFEADIISIGARKAQHWPEMAPALHPATPRELELLDPRLSAVLATEDNVANLFDFVDAETPTGTVNGTNTTFTLATAPDPASSLELHYGGVLLTTGSGTDQYTLADATLTLGFAPVSGIPLVASYRVLVA